MKPTTSSCESTSSIVSSVVTKVSTSAVGRLPCVENLSRYVRRMRAEFNPLPADPTSASDFVIPASILLLRKTRNF